MSTLTIDLLKEYRLKIEEKEDLASSFFSDIYKDAFKQVDDIVRWTNEFKENKNENDFRRESFEYNNIIAFTGGRGTGKTSAMLTVAKALISSNNKTNKIDIGDGNFLNFDTTFETLHTIDPSRFEQDQNIIEVIIAELFEKFQDKIKNDNTGRESEKRDVLKAFQDVYQCLKTISPSLNSKKYDGDALETLSVLADATKLEDNMRNLIKLYLKYLHPKQAENNSILIIPIDDFDLNVKHAGMMAEQIRKYLMVPQVLVLMAINMEQFGDVKTQDVINDFKILLSASKMYELPRDVAARYILKLLPIERRIIIPNIRIERNKVNLLLHRGYELDINKNVTPRIVINENYGKTFEIQIFKYIYDHTGLFFVSRIEEYHTFLPDTLRELRNLLSVLGSFKKLSNLEMINEKDSEDEKKIKRDKNDVISKENDLIKRDNLEFFKEFFINTWINNYLLIQFQRMVLNSLSIPYSMWNKYFITSIVEVLTKERIYKNEWAYTEDSKNKIYNDDNEISHIINRQNHPTNVSLGDLIYFLEFLNRVYVNDEDIQRLVFSINCWYSININLTAFEKEDRKNIKDFVNGSVINKKIGVIRDAKVKNKNRLQFTFATLFDDKDDTPEYKFLKHNIFIRHDNTLKDGEDPNYRLYKSYVTNEIFNDPAKRFKKPTFNLFSFVYKDLDNVFPVPYNNLELWNYILDNIDRDYKEEANDAVLISYLFSQIYYLLRIEKKLQEDFAKHPIINLFINPTSTPTLPTSSTLPSLITESMKYKNKDATIVFVDNVYGKISSTTEDAVVTTQRRTTTKTSPK